VRLRRTTIPDAVKAVPERRLAWGVTEDGVVLVATPASLYVDGRALPWTSVERVGWATPLLRLTEIAEVEGAGAVHLWELAEDHGLAETIRERVTGSVAWSDVRSLSPAGSVRLVGRRVPGQDLLLWQVVWREGTDPSDPFLRAQVDAQLDGLLKTIG
jgi:hypothetical protein